VRNAFARADGPAACDLIVLPYVLDCQRGHGVQTMLIRILQQVEIDQEVLLIMSCTKATSHIAGGRDPKVVVETLDAMGFEITYLDITRLPYSFTMYGYGHAQLVPITLVARATRRAAREAARIFVRARSAPDTAPLPDLERRILAACQMRISCAHAFERCAPVEPIACDAALANLAAQRFVDLDIVG
jgi:hypothetical protein